MTLCRLAVVGCVMLTASTGFAQDPARASIALDLTRRVVFDPVTYGPTLMLHASVGLDWNSSQPLFFRNRVAEHNPRFTISGPADDPLIGGGVGNRQILTDALASLPTSLANNVVASVLERMLIERYGNHRKLLRAFGWAERVLVGAHISLRRGGARLTKSFTF